MDLFRSIPKVDALLNEPACQKLLALYPRKVVLTAVRKELDDLRAAVRSEEIKAEAFSPPTICAAVEKRLSAGEITSLRRSINGTGVVLHTNLGRSPLSPSLRKQLCDIAFGYSTLEYDTSTGERGTRYAHVEQLICQLTGAESALVVNNNAAAVLLVLSALAKDREVIVSRGELVEIGGSFRIPEVMQQSGSRLKEVGSTNRTHLRDYRSAINDQTAILMKVHCSNFAVVGFTSEVSVTELAALGREFGVLVVADIGSGNLLDWQGVKGIEEPRVQESLASGADLVTFSGDKLLGGPQAGIIAGKASVVNPLKKHPLLRALRVDKLTLAVLEGTLRLYRDERQACSEIPTLKLLRLTSDELKKKGVKARRLLCRRLSPSLDIKLVPGISQVGGGALQLAELPTWLLAISSTTCSARHIEEVLRAQPVPVIGRIAKGDFLLDLRTIFDEEWGWVIDGLLAVIASVKPASPQPLS